MWNTVKLRPLLFFLSMEKIANNVKILHKVTHEIIHITLIAETLYGYALYETRTNFNLLRYTEKISKYFEIYARSIFGKIFHAKCSSSFANHFIFLCFLRFHESLPCPPKKRTSRYLFNLYLYLLLPHISFRSLPPAQP